MSLNRACIGKICSAEPLRVTAAAIRNYARACNETNRRYFDRDCRGGMIAPPAFAAVVSWIPLLGVLTDPQLGADLLRLLHTGQEIDCYRPIRPDDEISATARIILIENITGGEALSVELNAADARGERLNRAVFTALIRGRRKADPIPPITPACRPLPIASVTETIDLDQGLRYAEASGDRNPIHVDANVAKMAGLPRIIVHGVCTMAFAARAIIDRLCGADPTRLRRLALRFSRPVFPGDSLTTQVWPSSDQPPRRYCFETINSEGLAVIRDGVAIISAK